VIALFSLVALTEGCGGEDLRKKLLENPAVGPRLVFRLTGFSKKRIQTNLTACL